METFIVPTSEKNNLAILDIFNQQIITFDKNTGQIKTIIEDIGYGDGIQVDTTNGFFYWTDMGAYREGEDFLHPDGAIYRSKLDGSDKLKILGDGQFYTPKQLRLDHTNQKLYWCDREGGAIFRANTDGSELEKLVDRGIPGIYPKHKLDQCVGIALDKHHSHLYWTQKGTVKGGQGRIFRADFNFSSNPQFHNISTLLDHLPEPIDLEIDHQNQILYWTDRGAEPNGNSLNAAKITAHGLEDHQVLVHGFKEAIGMVLDKSHFYVSDLSGCVYRIDINTLEKELFYSAGQGITGMVIY